jgi:hypothetical protein
MRTIRASEIGTYLFCHRAWYLQDQGFESQNQMELAGGSAYHQEHGRQVFVAGMLRTIGLILLLAALIAVAVAATQLLFP